MRYFFLTLVRWLYKEIKILLNLVDPGLRKCRQKRGFLSVCHLTLSSLSLSVFLNHIWGQSFSLSFSTVPTGNVDLYHNNNIAQIKLNQTSTNILLTPFSKFDFAINCLYSNFVNKMFVLEKVTVVITNSNIHSMTYNNEKWTLFRNHAVL